jgi:ribosomal protein S18 acetylase RimI-like enzyme
LRSDIHDAAPKLTVATDADVPEAVSLINLAFRRHSDDAEWSTEEEYIGGTRITEDLLREDMAKKKNATLLLWRQSDDELLGCVWVEPEHDGTWYLGTLTIAPLEQNAGLGSILLRAAENWVQQRGATEIKMSVVHLRTQLIEWYKRRGYWLTEDRKPFPYGDDRYGTPKRDDLYFVALRKVLNGAGPRQPA